MVLIIGLINIGNAPWVQAHEDDAEHTHNIPSDHPLLSALNIVQLDDNGSPLGSPIAGAFTWAPAFDGASAEGRTSRYKVSAVYDVEGISVDATAAGSPNDGAVAVRITRNGRELASGADKATTAITVGVTMIEVSVTNPSNQASTETTYVVELTRELPQFDELTLHHPNSRGATDPAQGLTNTLGNSPGNLLSIVAGAGDDTDPDILKGSNTLQGHDASLRDSATDVRVKYHIDMIGLELSVPEGMRRGSADPAGWEEEVIFNTTGVNDTTTAPTYEIRNHPLRVGKNEIQIMVRSTSTRSHRTNYRIVIERASPQLKTAYYILGDDAVGDANEVDGFGLDVLEASTSVNYMETTTNVTAGGTGAEGDVEFKYTRKSGEGRNDFDEPDTESYDGMRLARGSNTLYITAYDKENPANGETKYSLEVVREDTPLGLVTLTASSTKEGGLHSATSALYWDADKMNQTSTREGFESATITYWSSVEYDVEEIQVAATSPTLDSSAANAANVPSAGVKYTITIKSRGVEATTSVTTADMAGLAASLTKLIPLRLGSNVITVKAEVPGNATTYTLNVERMGPVLRPSELAVVEYKDNRGRFDFANVELSPMYDQASSTVMRYEANVRSHIASVGIAANHDSPLSRIFVSGAEVVKTNPLQTPSVDYNERQLTGDMTTIPVDVLVDGQKGTVNIVVIRNEGGDLQFQGDRFPEDSPIRLMDGRALANPIILPGSSSDDGAVTYNIQVTDDHGEIVELSELGLELDQATRHITGTPTLGVAQGYESEFNVEYWASDPVGKETARREFVILITHDAVPQIPARTTEQMPKNRLMSLKVDGESVLNFDPASSGPYTAEVESDARSAMIEAEPEYADSTVALGNVQFGDNNTLVTNQFGVQLTITVSNPDEDADMTYTLTINRKDAPEPGVLRFSNDVGTKTYQADMAIEDLKLPDGVGGDGNYTFALVDHDGDATPADLEFNVNTRVLSGTPVLYDDAFKTTYKLTYTVTDGDGNENTQDFNMVICDPDSSLSGDCRSSSSMVELSSLELSDVALMPAFAPDTMMYTSEVPYETMMTTVAAMDMDIDTVEVEIMPADADMDMDGHQVELASGASTMITVTAMKEYGGLFEAAYTVDVMRSGAPSGPTMTEMLTEWRSDDMMMATLTWAPDMMNGEAAAHQYVFSVAKNAGDPVAGVGGLDLSTFAYGPTVAGDAYMVELTGLMADRDYVYGVIALFGEPGNWSWGQWEITNLE
jgi:hypothetical protein